LRDRVNDAALSGTAARHAAARFGIGAATAIIWVRRARTNVERQARKRGQPRRSKLDPRREYVLELIGEVPGLTISGLLGLLLTDRGVREPGRRFGPFSIAAA
jgi:transposase